MSLMNVSDIFGGAGLIGRAMKQAYEERPQQGEMAAAVEKALAARTHLIVEAGTGTGKSLAYLVPAILFARAENCRVVVSTYTKALQHQLMDKDLPFLASVLGDFRYALCVGGENYLCLRRFDSLRIGSLYEQNEVEPLNRLFEWSVATKTGLKSELAVEPPFLRHDREPLLGQRLSDRCPVFDEAGCSRADNLENEIEVLIGASR